MQGGNPGPDRHSGGMDFVLQRKGHGRAATQGFDKKIEVILRRLIEDERAVAPAEEQPEVVYIKRGRRGR